jgi:hypothetical protein
VFPLTDDFAANEVTLLPVANHLRTANSPKRTQSGHQINGFENIRFSLSIIAKQQVESGRKIHVQPRIIAEVTETQMGQMHSAKMNCAPGVREIFSGARNELFSRNTPANDK